MNPKRRRRKKRRKKWSKRKNYNFYRLAMKLRKMKRSWLRSIRFHCFFFDINANLNTIGVRESAYTFKDWFISLQKLSKGKGKSAHDLVGEAVGLSAQVAVTADELGGHRDVSTCFESFARLNVRWSLGTFLLACFLVNCIPLSFAWWREICLGWRRGGARHGDCFQRSWTSCEAAQQEERHNQRQRRSWSRGDDRWGPKGTRKEKAVSMLRLEKRSCESCQQNQKFSTIP